MVSVLAAEISGESVVHAGVERAGVDDAGLQQWEGYVSAPEYESASAVEGLE